MTKSNKVSNKKELSADQREELLTALKARFERNMSRHQGFEWVKVRARLEANPEKLWSLTTTINPRKERNSGQNIQDCNLGHCRIRSPRN
jgi:hypothetical protein